MSVLPHEIESLEGFQNRDESSDWLSHDPIFEWTDEDLAEFTREDEYAQQVMEAMAGWWEDEGARCATFGRDPNQNPYKP